MYQVYTRAHKPVGGTLGRTAEESVSKFISWAEQAGVVPPSHQWDKGPGLSSLRTRWNEAKLTHGYYVTDTEHAGRHMRTVKPLKRGIGSQLRVFDEAKSTPVHHVTEEWRAQAGPTKLRYEPSEIKNMLLIELLAPEEENFRSYRLSHESGVGSSNSWLQHLKNQLDDRRDSDGDTLPSTGVRDLESRIARMRRGRPTLPSGPLPSSYPKRQYPNIHLVRYLLANPSVLSEVAAYIPSTLLNASSFSMAGIESIVFIDKPSSMADEPWNKRVYKIRFKRQVNKNFAIPPGLPNVAYPIDSKVVGDVVIEMQQYYDTKRKVSGHAADKILYTLASRGVAATDLHQGNVTLDWQNNPVVYDTGYMFQVPRQKQQVVHTVLKTVAPEDMRAHRDLRWSVRKYLQRGKKDAIIRKASEPRIGESARVFGEASIDAITPSLMKTARSFSSMTTFRKPKKYTAYKEKTIRDMVARGKHHLTFTPDSAYGTSSLGGKTISLHKFAVGGMPKPMAAYSPPETTGGIAHLGIDRFAARLPMRQKNPLIAHELVHSQDKGLEHGIARGKRHISKKMRLGRIIGMGDYIDHPHERHAYSAVAGGIGMRALHKSGLPDRGARKFLTRPEQVAYGVARHAWRKNPRQGDTFAYAVGPALQLMQGEGDKRSRHKLGKELYKGYERAYKPGQSIPSIHHKINARASIPKHFGESARVFGEASIDAFTPEVYKKARSVASQFAHHSSGSVSPRYRTMMKVAASGKAMRLPARTRFGRVTLDGKKIALHTANLGGSAAYHRSPEHIRGAKLAISPFLQGGRTRDIVGYAAHELVHAKDKGIGHALKSLQRGASSKGAAAASSIFDPSAMGEYTSRPHETHAYSAMSGGLGMRTLKKVGVKSSTVRALLHKPSKRTGRLMRGVIGRDTNAASLLAPSLSMGQGAMASADKKAKHKYYKELYKGYERAYKPGQSIPSIHHKINARASIPKHFGESARVFGEAVTDLLPSIKDVNDIEQEGRRKSRKFRVGGRSISFRKGRIKSKYPVSLGNRPGDDPSSGWAAVHPTLGKPGHHHIVINPDVFRKNKGERISPKEGISHELTHYRDPSGKKMYDLQQGRETKAGLRHHRKEMLAAQSKYDFFSPQAEKVRNNAEKFQNSVERKINRINYSSELTAYSAGSMFPSLVGMKNRGLSREVISSRLRRGKISSGQGVQDFSKPGMSHAARMAGLRGNSPKTTKVLRTSRNKFLKNMFLTTQHVYGPKPSASIHSKINARASIPKHFGESARVFNEGEDKWLRMKQHIRSSYTGQKKSKKEMNRLVYGAMRRRGWKPKRELGSTI